jgi:hypothetical protein
MVRAKFVVRSIARDLHWDRAKGEVQTIHLTPVTSGSDENTAFYEATPSGEIKLGTLNAEAAAAFELGKSYYVDFTKAEES